MIINYQSDVMMRDLKDGGFENEISQTVNAVKKFLQKEYKLITGKTISLKVKGDIKINVQTLSRVRTFVQAYQHYTVGGLSMDQIGEPSKPSERDVTKKWLDQVSNKRPSNDTRKKNDNQKK